MEALERIQILTGAKLRELRNTERGPRAKSPRRFAIWALSRGAGIAQREIADVLDVSYYQVGRVLGYMRKNGTEGKIGEGMKS